MNRRPGRETPGRRVAEPQGSPQGLTIPVPGTPSYLVADLFAPQPAQGLVLFAHGSGSGRKSPRNVFVAEALRRQGIGALLLDLLTPEEAVEDERTAAYRFDIPLLGRRLVVAVDWIENEPTLGLLPLGLYGASTGGAAAMIAAATRPARVRALVLRGARSDLADDYAARVAAPTLFVVGDQDDVIVRLNRETSRRLGGPTETTLVPGATHLFEEAGAMEAVAKSTVAWFRQRLGTT